MPQTTSTNTLPEASGERKPGQTTESGPLMPESALLHRSLVQQPHLVDHASGAYLHLPDGRRVLDACGGAAVAIIGHGNPEVIAATTAQMQRASYVHTMAYTTTPAEDLASCVLGMTASTTSTSRGPAHDLTRAYFVGSGSEANEAALKMARQYFVEKGEMQRTHFVSRRQAYHGNTLGCVAISSNMARRAPYEDILMRSVSFVSPAYAYQYQKGGETEDGYAQRLVDEIEAEFIRVGPEKIASFIAEPVVGATSGCVAAPRGYFKGVRALCTKYDILLHLDEIMCGVGRTGSYFAFEQEDGDVSPDIVTVGKGLGGGYVPIAGMLVGRKVVEALRGGTSAFNHGHTFQAHPVACAAALAVQEIVRREGLVARAAEMGGRLAGLLRDAFAGCKYVGDIRGRGLFWALEFVRDKGTKESIEVEVGFGARVQQAAFELGVAVYPGGGTVDGTRGDHVLLAPPLNVSEEDLLTAVTTLRKAYDEVEAYYDGLEKSS